jgi:hypothetical protein
MICHEVAMTSQAPTTTPLQQSSRSKAAIAVVITLAIGTFFYFDLGRFLSLDAVKQNRDQSLAFTLLGLLAMVSIHYKKSPNKPT